MSNSLLPYFETTIKLLIIHIQINAMSCPMQYDAIEKGKYKIKGSSDRYSEMSEIARTLIQNVPPTPH